MSSGFEVHFSSFSLVFLGGIQRIYYIANGDQGEKSEHVYMHSKDFSSQIKFTRISRMISLSKQEEDDCE